MARNNAARHGDLDELKRSLEDIELVNEREPKIGETPLHLASASGLSRAVYILIQNGARVNAVDFDGQTPRIPDGL